MSKLRFGDDALSGGVILYEGILERAQPRIVLTVGLPEALAVAARRLEIPVVEILHGKGYASVPWGWDRRPATQLPTDVFALDQRSAVTFQPLQRKGVFIHHIVDPWTQFFAQRSSQVPEEWNWPEGLDGGRSRIVVVSLQWGYAGDHGEYQQFAGILENGLFPAEMERAIRLTADDTQWLLRLHPVQMHAQRYGWARTLLRDLSRRHANVEWQVSSMLPLPTLLGKATHHVTMLSGSSYEAAEMGVPTALLCPTARPGGVHAYWFQDLVDNNYATRLSGRDPDRLLAWLNQTSRTEPLVCGSPSTIADAISRVLRRSAS